MNQKLIYKSYYVNYAVVAASSSYTTCLAGLTNPYSKQTLLTSRDTCVHPHFANRGQDGANPDESCTRCPSNVFTSKQTGHLCAAKLT